MLPIILLTYVVICSVIIIIILLTSKTDTKKNLVMGLVNELSDAYVLEEGEENLYTQSTQEYPEFYGTISREELHSNVLSTTTSSTKNKPMIAIFSQYGHAYGRLHTDLMYYLRNEFDFLFYNWSDPKYVEFFLQDYKFFDKIVGSTHIVEAKDYIKGYNPQLRLSDSDILNKMYMVCHCPCINSGIGVNEVMYDFQQDTTVGNYAGVSHETQNMVKDWVKKDVYYTPCGVNLKHFPKTKKITSIKTLGYRGGPGVNIVKHPEVFAEIVKQSKKEAVYIYGKDWRDNDKMYDGIDLFICCSEFEGNPLTIFEAAACGIPVISTAVGNVVELKSIKTFKTVEEATQIIESLKGETLTKYIEDLYNEVKNEWSWEYLAHKWWKPFLEKHNTFVPPQKVLKTSLDVPILVINLKHRTDRLKSITSELKRMDLYSQSTIVEGDKIVAHNTGTAGVASSHAKCLRIAKKNNYPYVIILQDDCIFMHSKEKVHEYINGFLANPPEGWTGYWFGSVYVLGNQKKYYSTHKGFSQDTACLIPNSAYDLFIEYYEFCKNKYIETGSDKYNCDIQFMLNERYKTLVENLYLSTIKLCGQADNMSDRMFHGMYGGANKGLNLNKYYHSFLELQEYVVSIEK